MGGEGRGGEGLEKGREGELKCYIHTYIHTDRYTDPLKKWVVEELSLLKNISNISDDTHKNKYFFCGPTEEG